MKIARIASSPKPAVNKEGLTLDEFVAAARICGFRGAPADERTDPLPNERLAWSEGVDPTEFASVRSKARQNNDHLEYMKLVDRWQTAEVELLGIQPGDFVQQSDWFGDIWAEVESVYGEEGSEYQAVNLVSCLGKWNHVWFWQLRVKCHRKDAPWTRGEAGIVYTKEGKFGGRACPPLPAKFLGKV